MKPVLGTRFFQKHCWHLDKQSSSFKIRVGQSPVKAEFYIDSSSIYYTYQYQIQIFLLKFYSVELLCHGGTYQMNMGKYTCKERISVDTTVEKKH